MEIEKAIVYAEREGFRALELDVYRPGGELLVSRPVVVFIHGGGWRVGHRSRAPRETRAWPRGFFERIVDEGFVVVAPDYRLSGEAPFPAQRDDLLDALSWLVDHADELGIDPRRVCLWGASGGGALAALAGVSAEAPPIGGVVCWYPITDLTALDQEATDTFEAHLVGGPISEHLELARQASATCQVRAGAPPFLLQHGDADTWVPVDQSIRLAAALERAGVPVDLEVVPGADHFFEGADPEPIFERAMAFLGDLAVLAP
jgi:acetyl esterase/lipase